LVRAHTSRSVIAALSELAATVQRQRTVDAVLSTAGRGVLDLGMRLVAFQLTGEDLVLRSLATSPLRHAAIEAQLGGRSLLGLSAKAADVDLVLPVVYARTILFRHDLDVFATFLRHAAGYDCSPLDETPETRGVTNGVLAPIFVREEPWGLIIVYSRALTRADSDAVALFATHVGSAIEVAESLEALALAQEELVKQERLAALGELAAVVAHEVRNPLGVLFNSIGALKAIIDSGAPSERLEDASTLLSIAAEESHRLNRIVSDLLSVARPYHVSVAPCSISALVREAATDTAERADRIVIDVPEDLPLVDLDDGYMRQALLNLLLNALQAGGDDDVVGVTIRARVVGNDRSNDRVQIVQIDVIDGGPGIPESVKNAIFQPFFTTKASGTGLGLAIVKRIIDAHGGDLTFETSSLSGTTFTIRLPVRSSKKSEPRPPRISEIRCS